jgi:predicted nucleic acid-binding protein
MAFWDASAVVAFCSHQPRSGIVRRLVRKERRMVVWWGTPVEVRSALARLVKENALLPHAHTEALKRLREIRRWWFEVTPTDRLRDLVESLPDRLSLRAGDAFQLAAALRWCDERPRGRSFVCFDRRLADAAAGLGFVVEG